MQAITKSDLRKEINVILKDADLNEMSAKKVRQALEKKFKVELITLRKEIDKMVMDFVNSQFKKDEGSDNDSDGSDDKNDDAGAGDDKSEEETTKKKATKRPPPTKKPATKKSRGGDSSNESGSDDDGSEDEYKPQKIAKTDKKKAAKKDSDSDSDGDGKKKKTAAAAAKKPATKGKGNGFTRAYTLSADLAELMGSESMARHEVVKKVWQIIKERNLYDPKNKQYAICDDDLLKVMGVKRFRTFGMLKYLRNHFID